MAEDRKGFKIKDDKLGEVKLLMKWLQLLPALPLRKWRVSAPWLEISQTSW